MKRGMKKAVIISLTATMAFATSKFAYANTQALPNGTIVNQNGIYYLTDSSGEKYSGWFIDSKEDWYYFNESDKSMKTGWHHDEKDGYWYYLSLSDGKMVTGWQMIDGKEYFFQPVRDMGNYSFSNEQEKWLYSINSKVPYGAMYVNTTTPDGLKVDNQGVKIIDEKISTDNDTKTSDILKNGWVSENGKWYYYNAGAMIKDQWLNDNGRWYYLSDDGSMIKDSWKKINGKSYYFGSDGAMYVNTTTPDGTKVNENGERIKSLSIRSVIGNKYVLETDLETYQWWEEHGEEVRNDSRINVPTAVEQANLVSELYPQIPGRGAWLEYNFENNYWDSDSNFGVGGHGEGGEIIWKETTALLTTDYGASYNLKIIDENTIEIDGDIFIKVSK